MIQTRNEHGEISSKLYAELMNLCKITYKDISIYKEYILSMLYIAVIACHSYVYDVV